MKADIYLAFYDNTTGLGWFRSTLIKLLTRSKVTHVALIFDLPFASLTPMVLDGERCRLLTTYILEKKGAVLIYKKYMGSYNTCIEEVKKVTETHKVSTWYKLIFWFFFGRFIKYKPHHCGTLAVDWLNSNLGYKLQNRNIPSLLLEEVQHDHSNDWR